jgi:hypothetical protein
MLLATRGRTRGRGLATRGADHAGLIGRHHPGTYVCRHGAGLATMIQTTHPVFATIFARCFGERLTPALGFALLLNLCGVAVVVLARRELRIARHTGALSAAGAAVFAGAAVTAVRHLRQSEGAALITTYFMGVAALATMPALLIGLPHMSTHLVLALIGVVLSSIGGQWLLHHGLGFTTAAQACPPRQPCSPRRLEAAVYGDPANDDHRGNVHVHSHRHRQSRKKPEASSQESEGRSDWRRSRVRRRGSRVRARLIRVGAFSSGATLRVAVRRGAARSTGLGLQGSSDVTWPVAAFT